MHITKRVLLFILFVIPFIASSQHETRWNAQISGGPVVFYGDVMEHDLIYPALDNNDAWKFGIGAGLEYSLNRYLGLRGQLKYSEIGGIRNITDYYFDGTLVDVSLQARLNFSEILGNHNPYRTFNVYGLAGVGLSNWETERKRISDDQVVRTSGGVDVGMLDMTTEGFVPAGLGVSVRMSDKFDLNVEGLMNITNSDLLDAKEGGSKYDMYSYTSLGLTYKFGSQTTRGGRKKKDRIDHRIDTEKEDQEPVQKEEPSTQEPEPVEVTIESDIPEEIKSGQTFAATININKGNLDGAATLRQVFPQGIDIQPLSLAGGEYNFMNQVFTVNWMNMPGEQSNLKIAYRVKTADMDGGTYPISGIFTYTQDNKSKLTPFKNSLKVIAPEKTKEQIAQEKEDAGEYEAMKRGVVFRVQIRAKYQKKMSIQAIADRFHISEKIYEDYHNGYYIYTVGNFSTYEQARRKRDNLIHEHGVKDAFVTAFKNGTRVDKLKELDQFK